MIRTMLTAIIVLFFFAGTASAEDNSPISMSVKTTLFAVRVEITSHADKVTIKNLIINRGRCVVFAGTKILGNKFDMIKLPITLEFSDEAVFLAASTKSDPDEYAPCDSKIIEITAITDRGDWTFGF